MSLFEGERLEGQTAFITGASSGIGASCAERLADAGANLVLGARRLQKLEELRVRLSKTYPNVKIAVHVLDVNDDESVDAWLAFGKSEVGHCDILINNAGGARGVGTAFDSDPKDWQWMIDTNQSALFRMTRKVVPAMVERKHGDVVVIASVAGSDPYAGGSVYCATKAAVQAFAEVLRQETLGHNIRVLTFDPGLVETEFSLVRHGSEEKAAKVYEGLTPLSANDVADCVAFGLTRKRHMCVDRMLILATAQAGTRATHRE